jgi:predicted transcriptional regulator
LSRLQEAKLVEKSRERDHTFFFTTKRDPTLEEHSPTEKRVYDNINSDGISARKLAQKTAISLRRTYRYLRKLKGKKLIFARKKPVSYWLTSKGTQVTKMIHATCDLAIELLQTTALLAKEKQVPKQVLHEVYAAGSKSKHEETISSTSTPH